MTESVQSNRCSFCDAESTENDDLLFFQALDNKTFICEECIEQAYEKVEERLQMLEDDLFGNLSDEEHSKRLLKPSEILAFLDDFVIGQEQAKRVLSVAIYNHYKMLENKEDEEAEVEIEKSNILLVGPTGSGKTFLARTIARILDVPFASGDASAMTSAG